MAYNDFGEWTPDEDPNYYHDGYTDASNAAPGSGPTAPGAPAPGTQGTTGSTPGHTTLTPQQYVEAWRQQHPLLKLNQANSQPAWDQLAKDMKAVGFNVTLDDRPDGMHKGIMLDGGFVKLADGNDNAIWLPGGNAEGGGGMGGVDPSYLAPYTQTFNDYYGHAAGVGPGDMNLPQFQPFQAPTAASILDDPSYQFREGRLKGAVENSAAARGLTNSGGTVDSLLNNVGNFASQEYGNIWNRNFSKWNAETGFKFGRSNTAYDRAWQQYQQDRDTYYANQDRPFAKLTQGAAYGTV